MKQIAVVVDMQHDFLVGGALYVHGSEDIMDPIYQICKNSDLVIATRDWHPSDHSSFLENGGPWPKHCVKGTFGAQIYPGVDELADVVISKGMNKDSFGYSAGENPAFIPLLRSVTNSDDHIVVC